MLGPALFLVAILFLTTTVAIGGIGAFARASVQNAAASVTQTALNHSILMYQQFVQNQIVNSVPSEDLAAFYAQQGNATDPGHVAIFQALQAPANIPAPPANVEQISSYFVQETFANNSSGASCTNANPDPPLPDVVVAAQCSPWVYETRLAGSVTVSVFTGPPGTVGSTLLAQRTETITFRLSADAPFVSVVGLKDGDARDPTIDSVNQASQHEGDLGGYSSAVGPLGSEDAQGIGDTTIHLYYQCQNPQGGPCPGTPFPAGDNPKNLQWQNGNTPANP